MAFWVVDLRNRIGIPSNGVLFTAVQGHANPTKELCKQMHCATRFLLLFSWLVCCVFFVWHAIRGFHMFVWGEHGQSLVLQMKVTGLCGRPEACPESVCFLVVSDTLCDFVVGYFLALFFAVCCLFVVVFIIATSSSNSNKLLLFCARTTVSCMKSTGSFAGV